MGFLSLHADNGKRHYPRVYHRLQCEPKIKKLSVARFTIFSEPFIDDVVLGAERYS